MPFLQDSQQETISATDMAQRAYTPEQIEQFFERINLPEVWRLNLQQARECAAGTRALEYLTILQRYVLVNIPFENLELHYSRTQKIDLHPEVLFQKIVAQGNGRGGYCMETNMLFAIVLRTLGFRLYSTAGRVNSAALPDGGVGEKSFYYGFGHMVNIVGKSKMNHWDASMRSYLQGTMYYSHTQVRMAVFVPSLRGLRADKNTMLTSTRIVIDKARYLVDIGFGAGGPTKPVALEDGKEVANMPCREIRLRFGRIPENQSNIASKLWILERRKSNLDNWSPLYCFPDQLEFLYSDFLSLNEFPSTNPKSFFKQKICVVRHMLDDAGGEIVGEMVLFEKRLHVRVGKEVDSVTIDLEATRIQILEEEFGIKLDSMQQSAIIGMPSAIDES